MASIRFNLNKVRDHNYITLIYHTTSTSRLKMSMGEKVDIKYWDKKKQRVKPTHPNATTRNNLLGEIVVFIERVRNEYKIKGVRLSATDLRNLLQNRLYGKDDLLFKNYAVKWQAEMSIKKSTIKVVKNFVTKINEMYPDLSFDQVTASWHKGFVKRMENYSSSYTHLMLKKMKQITEAAYIDGIHTNLFYQSNKFLTTVNVSDKIFLNNDELNMLYDGLNEMSDVHRNATIIFLIGAYTGQRYGTYSNIDKKMVLYKGNKKMISIRQLEKTEARVTIPVSDKLMTLLDMEYHKISLQKINTYIKEACKIVGIKDWEKVTSHTARRSFATNAVLAGIDIHLIMKITGHKTESEFRKYVRIDDLMAAEKSHHMINMLQS
ncbi:MAG TPA: tyrosine-type recombinase/integrase [Saprospiraceae bacterium]|nr:tyrosine-type recombinase/integrase [Saprospiraceae bacterium]